MSELEETVPLPSNQAEFEAALMRVFAEAYPDLGPAILQQFAVATVADRHGSRVGCFTHFDVPDECPLISGGTERVLNGPEMRIRGIRGQNAGSGEQVGFGLAGSLLFQERGKISMLECFAYGESWPEDRYDFEFLPAPESSL